MDKAVIQQRTKEMLEKAYMPEEFIRELQKLLQSLIDKEATKKLSKNYS